MFSVSVEISMNILTFCSLELLIDAKNTDEWTECIKLNDLPFQKLWLQNAHIGMSASTGQLADNHDVLSITSYSDNTIMEIHESTKVKEKDRFYLSNPGEPLHDKVAR